MKRNFDLLVFLFGLIAGAAVGITLSNFGLIPSFHRAPPERIRNLSAASPGAQPPHVRGDENTAVTLEEFADFQCPPCAGLYPELKRIEAEYGSRLRVIFRHFPLSMHRYAVEAARASEAAALQGHFWEMHDRLYESQEQWGESCDVREQFTAYARDLGLDVERFKRDLDSTDVNERIRLDQQRGESIEIDGTPTLFLNAREIPSSSRSPEGMRAMIDAALKGK
jgi:protein-disulfide isomerase